MSSVPYNYSYIFKYIVIGDMGVGKSSLVRRFTEGKFTVDYPNTIGMEYGTKVVTVCGQNVKLQIWDTAGHERFKAVTQSYYRGAAGALIVYDITRRSTYNSVGAWLADARERTNLDTAILLIGNKADLEDRRDVTYEEAWRFAEENGLVFAEASAKTDENVQDLFVEVARRIYHSVQEGSPDLNAAESGIQRKPSAPQGGAITFSRDTHKLRDRCSC